MTTEEEEGEEELLPMPMVNLFSKEMFLTKRLTHGHAANNVRLQVFDRFARIRPNIQPLIYNHINPDRE